MLSALRTYIIADSAVAALIGTRFYPNTAPQNPTKPYCTYQPISEFRRPTMRHDDNLPSARVQIDCWSTSVDQARAVADAIRALFHYYEPESISGVQGVFADNGFEGYEPETLLHRVSRDYIVHYAEA